MEGLSITLIRAASEMGQLYGSASSRDISNAVSEAGFTISRNQVDLNTSMKTLGLFDMRVNLHPEVAVEIKVNIARSDDEAAEQLRLGRAIISDIAEREREEAAEAARAAADQIAAQEAEEEDTTNADAGEDTAEAAGEAEAAEESNTEEAAATEADTAENEDA